MAWLHCSPAKISVGDFVTPASTRGGMSRTYPDGYGEAELRWYDPDKVYVFESDPAEPRQQMGRFVYTREDYYWYEVEPEGPLGRDADVGASIMQSATCRRARVLRCLHIPGAVDDEPVPRPANLAWTLSEPQDRKRETTVGNQVEDAAIAFVTDVEQAAGRPVQDTRRIPGAPADLLCGERIVEVKAYGGSARGQDLWLEPVQVQAALTHADRFWVYVVDNVAQGDSTQFKLLRLGGSQLADMIALRREQHYFTVPFPVSAYDAATAGPGA